MGAPYTEARTRSGASKYAAVDAEASASTSAMRTAVGGGMDGSYKWANLAATLVFHSSWVMYVPVAEDGLGSMDERR